jgi:hypothetical protein
VWADEAVAHGGAEFFKWFEIGKSPSRDQRYTTVST